MSLIERRKFQAYEKFYENVRKELKGVREKLTHNRSGKRSSSKSSESDEQMSDTELPKAEVSVISDPPQNTPPVFKTVVKIWPLISEFLRKFEEVYTFKDKKIFGVLNFLDMKKLRTALHKREVKAGNKYGEENTLSLEAGQPEGLDPVKEKLSDAVFFLQKAKLTMKGDINKLGPEEYAHQLNTLSDLQVLLSGFLTELKRESVKK